LGPFYKDVETGWYYLNSRYYNPEIGRDINAKDVSEIVPTSINGANLYTYSVNNPVAVSAYTERVARVYGASSVAETVSSGSFTTPSWMKETISSYKDIGSFFKYSLAAGKYKYFSYFSKTGRTMFVQNNAGIFRRFLDSSPSERFAANFKGIIAGDARASAWGMAKSVGGQALTFGG
jgi:RHS repeat-associated protein